MKISKIEAIPFNIPFKQDMHFQFALRVSKFCNHVLVKVHTDEGITGIAEAPPRPHIYGCTQRSICTVIEEALAPSILGMNPFDLEPIHYRLEKVKENLTAKAAVDVALHDVIGRATGQPVYRLLGGWNEGPVPVSWMMGINEPDKMAAEAGDLFARGIKAFKVKVGLDLEKDLESFQKIREAVGDEALLYIDANQAYAPFDAIDAIRAMEEYGLAWAEEPVSKSIGQLRRKVADSISVPISGDESCFTPAMVAHEIREGVIGLVVMKIARSGYFQAKKIVNLCEQAGLPCLVGSQGDGALGTVAAVHFAKAFRNIRYPIENTYFLRLEDDLLKEPVALAGGLIDVAEKPGLGVEIDEEKLERYRVRW
jgi:L-alanine-DL-glutamate epimerase-like enolase superfamily enzyme